jgi:membrane-bound lytic murein transglycosylase D
MKTHPIFATLLLAAVLPLPAVRAQWAIGDWENLEPDYEKISATGQALMDTFAPDAIRNNYQFASPEQLTQTFQGIQNALSGEDLSLLADLQPAAKQALNYLSMFPQTQGIADWLSARLDYFDIATEARQVIPTPKSAQPPKPQTPAPPPQTGTPANPSAIPAPPAEPAPTPAETRAAAARERYAEDTQTWIRKLKDRPAPARAAALLPVAKAAFRAQGVPEALVWQAEAESTFNPSAKSPVGALGLFQFMPPAAKQYGLSLDPNDERLDAAKSSAAAAKYLSALHRRFGDWALALAAYNCGEGRVSKTMAKTGGKTFADIQSSLPAETRLYVPKIDALLHLRENTSLSSL